MTSGVRTALRRLVIATTALLALTLAGAGGFYAAVGSGGNFHAVEPGAVYRSAQLSGPELEEAIGTYGIKSILNLRGAHPGRDWYDAELAASNARHVAHYDYGLDARRTVTPEQLAEILQIIRDAPKPILIHCKAGSDRTGLVSAIYLYTHGESAAEADGALSLRYGHFPWLGSRTRAMDESFEAYVGAGPGAG